MDALKKKRGVLKASLTRFANSLQDPDIAANIPELKLRLEKAESLFDQFEDQQTLIDMMTTDAEDIRAQEQERSNFEKNYYAAIAKCRELINGPDGQNRLANASPAPTAGMENNVFITPNLPKMRVPKFNGDNNKWLKFRDSFNSLIDQNPKFSNIQKFHYLEDALEGKAAKIIESMGVSEENYAAAWEKIKKRYEDSGELIHHHVSGLFKLPVVTSNSPDDLRDLIDSFENHVASLKSLEQPVQHWDTLLIYLLSTKLSTSMKTSWEKKLADDPKLKTKDGMIAFLESECKVLKRSDKGVSTNKGNANTAETKKHVNATKSYITTARSCLLCSGPHSLYGCDEFKKLSTELRSKKVAELKACFNCLNKGHQNKDCTFGPCKKCGRKHNSLLHFDRESGAPRQQQPAQPPPHQAQNIIKSTPSAACKTEPVNESSDGQLKTYSTRALDKSSEYVLLGTAIIYVYDKEGVAHECRALLDSCSQPHLMSAAFCDRLGLDKFKNHSLVTGIEHGVKSTRYGTTIRIKSRTTEFRRTVTCIIVDEIDNELPCPRIRAAGIRVPKGIKLADPEFDCARPVDLLIGAAMYYELLSVGQIKLDETQPIFQKTVLGWIAAGRVMLSAAKSNERVFLVRNQEPNDNQYSNDNQELIDKLEKFWNVENCFLENNADKIKIKNDPAEVHFRTTTVRDETGRFVVSIPFENSKLEQIGESRALALKRFEAVEKKLAKNPVLNTQYSEFMTEYLRLGHMTELQEPLECDKPHFYLPHHAVIKHDSTTTKLRVVFDGSAKTSSGLSLNDVQYLGQTVQDDLFSIILRFRKHQYVLSADIAKMYRQILVNKDQRSLQRILWRSDRNDPVKTYELNTVTYGTKSAPFLATRCLHELGISCREQLPAASDAIINDFYVDDLLTGAETVDSAVKLKMAISEVLTSAGMELRKWASNEPNILNDKTQQSSESILIQGDKDPKTLGLLWDPKGDTLKYRVNFCKLNKVSKRSILSTISQIYDPLGLVGPAIINAKVIMQKLWSLNLEWDESLPQDLHESWTEIYGEIMRINEVKINRRVIENDRKYVEYHGFCDASERAYGATIYTCCVKNDGTRMPRLLCAKSRVAPLKSMSIPRLELLSAVLLAQLSDKVSAACQISKEDWYFWSDSMVVLSWIRTPSHRWKTFVANRVAEIQELTSADRWNHVETSHNPADLISRGTTATELRESQLWWFGPSWLSRNTEHWPKFKETLSDDTPEQRAKILLTKKTSCQYEIFDKYSSFSKLIRVTAFLFKFVNNCRTLVKSQPIKGVPHHKSIKSRLRGTKNVMIDKSQGWLRTEQLNHATNYLIKLAQNEIFEREIILLQEEQELNHKSILIPLNPFVDVSGLLRVGGRLKNAMIPFDEMYPIILPPNHKLTELIINHEHKRLLHAGCQAVLASVRRRYWPIQGKNTVRRLIRSCILCVRARPSQPAYLMGNLPAARVVPARAFLNCGVDYAGPFLTKEKTRSHISTKSYVCIFVCFVTKAVHIDLATDLTTDAFLNCFKRFISRRGLCRNIYSDNGKNFVGARNELRELNKLFLDRNFQDEIVDFFSSHHVDWHFIPPHAPHFGGLWESAVKSAKYHMKRVIGETRLTFEELYTLLTQIEACMNSRPLTPLTNNPDDLTPLTPGHFLIGDSLTALPQEDVRDIMDNRLNRFELIQKMQQHFWQRWHREYLPQLQTRKRWKTTGEEQVKLGSMVLVKDDNAPPMQWPLGRIIELHPGDDGIVRVVTIRISKGVTKQPVAKICMLPVPVDDDIITEEKQD